MSNKTLSEIKERLEAARPAYEFIDAIMGSGQMVCTAVAAEDGQTGHKDFIADVCPDYVINNLGDEWPKYKDIGFDGQHARIAFLKHVWADMDHLLETIARLEREKGLLQSFVIGGEGNCKHIFESMYVQSGAGDYFSCFLCSKCGGKLPPGEAADVLNAIDGGALE